MPAVVLLSGGMDSTTLLYEVCRSQASETVLALSFNYGQRHLRELDCARTHARALKVARFEVADLTFLAPLLRAGTTLIAGGAPVPDLDALAPALLDQPPTYVPHRNMMLLSVAAAYAESQGAAELYYGAQAADAYGYWDCSRAFVERFNQVLSLNRRQAITVHAPFANSSKADIIRRGMLLGVNFAETWSCYRGGAAACGTCPTCVERLRAFAEAGIDDPLPYEKKEQV